MPVTPVGQIPYPQGTDKPLIPADMKSLATVADGWVSGMDTLFQGRVNAVQARLNAVQIRVFNTNSALTTANDAITSGNTAITSEQSALTVAEGRLATQDVTALNLQNRYTTDINRMVHLETKTPKGVNVAQTTTVSGVTPTTLPNWVAQVSFTCDGPGARYRVFYSESFALSRGSNTEFRLCWGTGTSANWANTIAQAFCFGNFSYSPVSLFGVASGMPAGQVTIALGVTAPSDTTSWTGMQNFGVQEMTSA